MVGLGFYGGVGAVRAYQAAAALDEPPVRPFIFNTLSKDHAKAPIRFKAQEV